MASSAMDKAAPIVESGKEKTKEALGSLADKASELTGGATDSVKEGV